MPTCVFPAGVGSTAVFRMISLGCDSLYALFLQGRKKEDGQRSSLQVGGVLEKRALLAGDARGDAALL